MSQNVKKMLAGVVGVAALAVGGSALAGAATSQPSTTTTPTASARQRLYGWLVAEPRLLRPLRSSSLAAVLPVLSRRT